jgi:hypothetical protein
MDTSTLVTEYVLLGLRFDRIAGGFVDAYIGDPALRRRVDNEPRPEPAKLALRAGNLRTELRGAELSEQRRRFLDAQLTALECSGRKLVGEPISFLAEAEAYFQVRVVPGEPDEYRRAHAELDETLPGKGTLAERITSMRARDRVPAEKLRSCLRALSRALRERVRSRFGLPPQEVVDYRVVTGKPWSAFNRYLGDYRSRVAINADLGHRAANLPHLVAHEAYPGHHTEHCRKDRRLVGDRGQREQTVFLVNTPQCLMAEGLADLGLHAAIGPGWGSWAAEVLAELGVLLEGELAERVDTVMGSLRSVRQDAVLMLHDRHQDESDVLAYLQRWLLIPESRARRLLRFMADPLWRAYTTTYVEGYRLLRDWMDARPDGVGAADRYRRLLDEPLVPEIVRAELIEQPETPPFGGGDFRHVPTAHSICPVWRSDGD